MSGVEIAGLVLAVIPLVISALEHYEEGFSTLSEWWMYRTAYLNFSRQFSIQTVFLKNHLESLLSELSMSQAEMQELLADDPGGGDESKWKNPELEKRLRQRLPDQTYVLYLQTVTSMLGTMRQVQSKLSIVDGSLQIREPPSEPMSSESAKGWWKKQHSKLRFSFSRSKRKMLLHELTRDNETLDGLIQSSDRLTTARKKNSAANISKFCLTRRHAAGLHDVVDGAWGCFCRNKHSCSLVLHECRAEQRNDGSDELAAQFEALLQSGTERGETTGTWTFFQVNVGITKPIPAPSFDPIFKSDTDATLAASPSPRKVTFSFRDREKGKSKGDGNMASASPATTVAKCPPHLETELDSLCNSISRSGASVLGFVWGHGREKYIFRRLEDPDQSANSYGSNPVSLDSLLAWQTGADSCSLNRMQRFYISVLITISVLELSATPWITDTWSKKNVLVELSDETDATALGIRKVYILPPDGTTAAKSNRRVNVDCSKSISNLGILLLELCFGRRLEDYPGWQKFLGVNGYENESTCIVTALEWQKKVYGEVGPELAEAIRRCLVFAFEFSSRTLDDETLANSFLNQVLRPIEDNWRMYSGKAAEY